MARINLLPWREELRQEKKKEFVTQLVAVCIFTALICFAWVRAVDGSISSQKARNNILKNEISLLESQVEEIQNLKRERQALLDRMRVIQDLEGKRAIIVHYFDEFAKAVPNGVHLTAIKRTGDTFSIEGVSESNPRLSIFMRQLDASEWFSGVNLLSATASPDNGEQAKQFSLNLMAVLPDSAEESDG